MDKKQLERRIVNLIYEEEKYAEITDSEEPDFRIRHRTFTESFGVEVTVFHRTESQARIRMIPEYFDEILADQKYRHKHDKTELAVHEAVIYDAQANEKSQTKCMIHPDLKIEDYVQMIGEVIESKDNKFPQYQKDFTHINLVIFDAEAAFFLVSKEEYFPMLFTKDLKDILFKTSFREVFIITALDQKWVYIPLKMNLLVGEWYLFHKLINEFIPDRVKKYEDEFQVFFAQYMQYKTGHAYYRRHKRYKVEVIWGNTGVMDNKPQNSILDHADYPLSPGVIKPTLKGVKRFFESSDFHAKQRDMLEKYRFTTRLIFYVKGPVDIFRPRMKSFVAAEVKE